MMSSIARPSGGRDPSASRPCFNISGTNRSRRCSRSSSVSRRRLSVSAILHSSPEAARALRIIASSSFVSRHLLRLPSLDRAYLQQLMHLECCLVTNARRTGPSGRCWSGCCGRSTGTPAALLGRDGRGVASTEMASCVAVERRPRGFVALRFDPCRAGKGRGAERHLQTSTCPAAADQGTQESFRAHRSRLERYAGRRPKSSAGRLIDCEEDRTLRAVLVGMLRETDHRTSWPGLT
jgi:hypothetical protein